MRLEKLQAAESRGGGSPQHSRKRQEEQEPPRRAHRPGKPLWRVRSALRDLQPLRPEPGREHTASLQGAAPRDSQKQRSLDSRPGPRLGHVKRSWLCPDGPNPGFTETGATEPQLPLGAGSATLQTPGLRSSAAAHHPAAHALAAQLPRAPCQGCGSSRRCVPSRLQPAAPCALR